MKHLSRNLFISSTVICLLSSNAFAREGGSAGAAAGGTRAGMDAMAAHAQAVAAPPTSNQPLSASSTSSNTSKHVIDYKGTAVSCQYPTLMDGWYMGAQIGYGPYRVRNSINAPGTPEITSNLVAAATGWAAGVTAGYGKMLNQWFYLGGELFIDANNFDQNFSYNSGPTTSTYINKTSNGPSYGFGLLPGIKLTPSTLTYARLGWNRVKIKTFESLSDCVCDTNNVSKTMGGFVFGVGLETLITSNYSVRGEFDHMFVNSYNTTGIFNTDVNASSNQYMLTFIYHAGV